MMEHPTFCVRINECENNRVTDAELDAAHHLFMETLDQQLKATTRRILTKNTKTKRRTMRLTVLRLERVHNRDCLPHPDTDAQGKIKPRNTLASRKIGATWICSINSLFSVSISHGEERLCI